jgi:hypothetical protein
MAVQKDITGTVSYQDIGTGFWGITDTQGKDWRPIHMPDQLKVRGARVRCTIEVVKEDVSIFMWGTPVKIVSFYTPGSGEPA